MKINWFSPLPPAHSDVANYTMRVLPALSRKAQVVLWTDAKKVSDEVRDLAEVRTFQHVEWIDWRDLSYADYTIYNIGNDGRFHARIMQVAQLHPGIAIMHDLHVHELAVSVARLHKDWRRRYLDLLADHDADALADGRKLLKDGMTWDEIATRHPLTKWAFKGAHGVITHNAPHMYKIAQDIEPPILETPLAYEGEGALRPPLERSVEGSLQLVICGHLNSPNRRLEQVMNAISGYPGRETIQLHLIGQVADATALKKTIKELGLQKQVQLHGYVSEDRLAALLDQAHMAINLRWPSRGEASGAQLRFWNHSLPTLVTQTGWYGQLPTDSVLLVNPEREEEDIHRYLRQAQNDYEAMRRIGLNGRRILQERHTAEMFVENLLPFLKEVSEFRKRSFAPWVAARIADAGAFIPPDVRPIVFGSAAEHIAKIGAPLDPPAETGAKRTHAVARS